MLSNEEKVIASFIYNKNDTLLLGTKNGITKRTLMKDYEVLRCNKPIVAMKLKEQDELISVTKDLGQVLFITLNGYYVNYKTEEIPLIGAKASGVKGINLTNDEVKSMVSYDNTYEYITIFTDNKTAKRVKISDLDTHSRAKKGNLIIKKTKTVVYKILNGLITTSKDLIILKADSELNIIKNSDISIMDTNSTGSNISKYKLDLVSKVALKEKILEEKEEVKEEEKIDAKEKIRPLTMNDFLDDFKI